MFSSHIEAENDFGRYSLPKKAKHRPACQAVLRGDVWERETVEFLCENARGSIVHAGTFFGDFLPAISRHYRTVWAFEPNRDSYRCAVETGRLNHLQNVLLTNAGVGRSEGRAALRTRNRWGRYLGGGSRIIERPGRTRIVAIDDVIPGDEDIGAIHLDVEGYEESALLGARQTITRCKPLMVLETMPALVEELGYKLTNRINGNYVVEPV